MPSRHFLFVIGARALPAKIAVGAGIAKLSVDVTTARAAINGQDGKPIEITPDQWQFLRGVYAMNPEAPPGIAVRGQRRARARWRRLRRSVVLHRRRQAVRGDARAVCAAFAHGAGHGRPRE